MSIIDVDERERQCPLTLYLYLKQLCYLACDSSHLYGGGLRFKLLNLHSKLPKNYALWTKTSLKWWFRPQVAWFAPQVIQKRYLVPQGTTIALPQFLEPSRT